MVLILWHDEMRLPGCLAVKMEKLVSVNTVGLLGKMWDSWSAWLQLLKTW